MSRGREETFMRSRGGTAAQAQDLRIQNVSADRISFRPGTDDPVAIRFRLSSKASVTLRVYDSRDLLIRSIRSEGPLDAGDRRLSWDGRSEGGERVPPEAYFYTLTARSPSGQKAVYDVTDLTGGEDAGIPDITYDSEAGSVRYVLPGPSRVGLRVGMAEGGALLATIVNWEPRGDLANTEAWGGIHGIPANALAFHGQYFRLPANAIIVPPAPGSTFEREFVQGATEKRDRNKQERFMYRHSQHRRDECFDFPISVDFMGPVQEGRDRIPVVGENVTLRIDVPPEDRIIVEGQRFEIVLYLDGVFITELEQGFIPYRWPLDSITMPAADHVLTVNLRGYEGHFGFATIPFRKSDGSSESSEPALREGSP
jgi:hypothetical protein